jgi:hypothetical protein
MSNKNEKKLEEIRKANLAKGKKFTSDYQPSPKAKSKGWDRRQEAMKILNEFMTQSDMTVEDLKNLEEDIDKNPDKHTVREWKIMKYIKDNDLTRDWLDRNLGKATQEIDITSKGEKLTAGIFIDDPED